MQAEENLFTSISGWEWADFVRATFLLCYLFLNNIPKIIVTYFINQYLNDTSAVALLRSPSTSMKGEIRQSHAGGCIILAPAFHFATFHQAFELA